MWGDRAGLLTARLVGAMLRPWHRRHATKGRDEAITDKPLTLITGATGGIGEAIALRLGRAGHTLLLTGRDETELQDIAARVRAEAPATVQTFSVAVDLQSRGAAALIDEICASQGFYVDVLINNAGLAEKAAFLNNDPQLIETVIDVNVTVLTRLMRHYLPAMVARGSGAVINMSSIGGLAPGPYQSVYYASKAYVTSITEAVAHEVRGRGVYVGAVLPGPTKSRFHERANGRGSYYLSFFGEMKADRVAATVERALYSRHWPLVEPGPFYALIGLAMRVIPGSLLTPLMGVLYKQRERKPRL